MRKLAGPLNMAPGAKTSTAWNNSLGSGDNLTISSPDNIVITGDEEINNITINSGASLTILKGFTDSCYKFYK